MVKENKTRVMITLLKSVDDDLMTLCNQMGISKSQFISMAVGEKIMGYKKAFEVSSEVLKSYAQDSLIKPIS